jgi:hypothetical protein
VPPESKGMIEQEPLAMSLLRGYMTSWNAAVKVVDDHLYGTGGRKQVCHLGAGELTPNSCIKLQPFSTTGDTECMRLWTET